MKEAMIDHDWAALRKELPRTEPEELIQGYAICSVPCGGGEILGSLLRPFQVAGLPHYFFHHNSEIARLQDRWKVVDQEGDVNYVHYFNRLLSCKATSNGVFSALVYPGQYLEHQRLLFNLPQFKTVFVQRADSAAQAVDVIEMSEQLRTNKKEVDYLYGNLIDCLTQLIREDMLMKQIIIQQSDCLVIDYRALIADPIKEVKNVLDYLNIEMDPQKHFNWKQLKKLIPRNSKLKDSVAARFKAILEKKKIMHN
jgi:LPS sulfotransferase NodH